MKTEAGIYAVFVPRSDNRHKFMKGWIFMKYTRKITASLLAALMISGTAAAVPAVPDLAVEVQAATYDFTYLSSVSVELYNTCAIISWDKLDSCTSYIITVCKAGGANPVTYQAGRLDNRLICPYSSLPFEYNSTGEQLDTDFYVYIVGLKDNYVQGTPEITPFLSESNKFTLKKDMSAYPAFGAPEKLTASVSAHSVALTWVNPVQDSLFRVKAVNSRGDVVFLGDTNKTKYTISKLLEGQTYTFYVTNKTYDATTSVKATTRADDVPVLDGSAAGSGNKPLLSPQKPDNSGSESSKPSAGVLAGSDTTPVSSKKLNAPSNLKAKTSSETVTLTWNKVNGADAYRVYIYDEEEEAYVRYKTVRSTKCTVSGLTNGKSYKFRVAGAKYNAKTKKYTSGSACKSITATPKSKNAKAVSSIKY